MRIVFHLLTFNGARYLPTLFSSLSKQTEPWELRIIDNGSVDESVAIVREYMPHAIVTVNARNLGFAEGHNQLLHFTRDHITPEEFAETLVVFLNQDIILAPDFVATLRAAATAHPEIAAFAPKLFRAESVGEDGLEFSQTDVLDSTGFSLPPTWRFEERGAGVVDHGQFDSRVDIVGVGGALAGWRLSALEEVKIGEEVFSSDFFLYREDCDLALRAARQGLASRFVPECKAWHVRGLYGAARRSLWSRLWDRRGNRPLQQALSSRNQLLLIVQNLTWSDLLLSAPRLIFQELGRTVYSFMFEKETRRYLLRAGPHFKRALARRTVIMARARLRPSDLRAWMRHE